MSYTKSAREVLKEFSSDINLGLTKAQIEKNRSLYGENVLSKPKEKSLLSRIISSLFEPMMIILLVAFFITLGVDLGKALKGENVDFFECAGILISILLSVGLSVIMEGRSKKAFDALNAIGERGLVRVIRQGQKIVLNKNQLVVGDVVLFESGDKINADLRLLQSQNLKVDESTLTGESDQVEKNENLVLPKNTPLADQKNMVFSGTYVACGNGVGVVVRVGDSAEIGKIAGELKGNEKLSQPLEQKLSALGKLISIFGGISAIFVFLLSFFRLVLLKNISFNSIQEIFISSIILIVAAVPEGLPTTAAISLTLNLLKLAKSNVLIKKLVATETIGSVSVICSDKTGTLTESQMQVHSFLNAKGEFLGLNSQPESVILNVAINSTAEIESSNKLGSLTEIALLQGLKNLGVNCEKIRKNFKLLSQKPFSSTAKFMETTGILNGREITFIKGAPEVILQFVTEEINRDKILKLIGINQQKSMRAIAFCHRQGERVVFDGCIFLINKVRKGVADAVKDCLKAGISVKMLTGDNLQTAVSVAEELGIMGGGYKAVLGDEIENMEMNELIEKIDKISVVARSTPKVKLKIVQALQARGEVVAVTGDGVNDAPAISRADIGISMGDGAEITKRASDVVLLDNSFSQIVRAIAFGRNIFRNFQRFITFQLTVNVSSLLIILVFLVMGMESPFSASCLLWLNVIMDGPLAISLALEKPSKNVMSYKPVQRSENLLNGKMLLKILATGIFITAVVIGQYLFNFLGVSVNQISTVTFATFVIFQLFNAINCRKVRFESSFKGIFDNKFFMVICVLTFILQIIITEWLPWLFKTEPLNFLIWLKITLTCSSVLIISELIKLIVNSWGGKRVKYDKNNR